MNGRNKYAGTQTEQNLWEAFIGESQARNKYSFFASVAKKQGFEQIAALFLKTAENERAHAKLWFKELGELGGTESNLDTEMKTDDYTQRNKTAANGFTGGTGKERPPDRRSDIQ